MSRDRLRTLLWGDKSDQHGAGSLRNCLWKIRQAFAAAGFSGFSAGADQVRFLPGTVLTDMAEALALAAESPADPRLPDLLRRAESFAGGTGEAGEEFAAWARDELSAFRTRATSALEPWLARGGPAAAAAAACLLALDPLHEAAARAQMKAEAEAGRHATALRTYERLWTSMEEAFGEEPSPQTQRLIIDIKQGRIAGVDRAGAEYCVGILPCRVPTGDPDLVAAADALATGIGALLAETGLVGLHDFRGGMMQAAPGQGIDALLLVQVLRVGMELSVEVIASRATDQRLMLSRRMRLPAGALLLDHSDDFAANVVDLMCDVLARPGWMGNSDRHRAASCVLYAIDQLFRLSNGSIDLAERALDEAIALDPRGPYLAWRAYAEAFRFEERKGDVDAEFREELEALMQRALAADRWNSLSRGLLTLVQAFVFNDFGAAHDMIRPALQSSCASVMVDDSASLLHFYCGRYAEAATAAERALRRGAFNPYRYLFETTLCMTRTMTGEFRLAEESGMRALAAHPAGSGKVFEPTLRYLAASQSWAGAYGRAEATIGRLIAQTPGFTVRSLVERAFPAPNRDAARVIADGLKRLGMP